MFNGFIIALACIIGVISPQNSLRYEQKISVMTGYHMTNIMPPLTSVRLPDEVEPPQFESKKAYKDTLQHWQKSLFHVQQAYFHNKQKALIVVEGWDAAGKGGAIRRTTELLDPRGFTVFPVGAPSAEEKEHHYLHRFWSKTPKNGHITVLDRSYYGRVLVERVDQLCTRDEWQRAYSEINQFEKNLSDDGVKIVKLFIHITADEQKKRFEERLQNPYKQWKLTAEDLHNRSQRAEYVSAISDMLALTHTGSAPWYVINGEHKWHARVDFIRHITQTLSSHISIAPPTLNESLIEKAKQQLGITF